MLSHAAEQNTSSPSDTPRISRAFLAVAPLLFALALLPRLIGLGEATTEDEDQWVQRTGGFAAALASGQWRGTYQIGHPGVTTMWLTELALGQDRARAFATRGREEQHVSQVPDFLPALHTARVPFAILSALLATACGLLAARLLGPGPGLLAGLLLALDPYWSAMSPIVGMDGLLAGLMGASLLSALLAFRPTPTAWRWALTSGLLAGLALLTKGAALFLLPMAPLLALLELWRARGGPGGRRSVVGKLLLWSLALVAAALIWPAMWVDPLGTARRAVSFILETGGSPHGPGNFFLGQPVADPGPLFYPVALGLRLGPATLLGLLALALFGPPRRCWTVVGPLLLYVLLLGLGLTLSPKKIDRYLLPLFPVLGVLAGLGWWLALRRVADHLGRPVLPAGLLLVGLVQLWPLVATWPHPLAAYNPLLGGIRTAERTLPVGWGEGLDTVGEYLRRQPDADQLVTGVWYPLRINFQAHAPGRVLNLGFSRPGQLSNQQLFADSDFYVDYIHARQRRLTPQSLVGRPPDFVVSIAGVDYARVYRVR